MRHVAPLILIMGLTVQVCPLHAVQVPRQQFNITFLQNTSQHLYFLGGCFETNLKIWANLAGETLRVKGQIA